MGADGHIKIYDAKKLESEFGDQNFMDFMAAFTSHVMYRQLMDGRPYITRYYGDNIDVTDMYNCILMNYNKETGRVENKYGWSYSQFEADEFMKNPLDHRQLLFDMIMFMEHECGITSWEVWT